MTDTLPPSTQERAAEDTGPRRSWRSLTRIAVTLMCALLGFLLVAQVRATEGLGERLESEREEDLARILSDLSAQSDRLQAEITERRLLLFEFESSAAREELVRRSLEQRLAALHILAGTVDTDGEGIVFTINDPGRKVTQELMVDAVQELRDAGAEAIAVNDVRLIASSAFTTRNGMLLVDREPIEAPYRIAAIGVADNLSKALAIRGGAIDTIEAREAVTTAVETRAQMTIEKRDNAPSFVFGEPVPAGTSSR